MQDGSADFCATRAGGGRKGAARMTADFGSRGYTHAPSPWPGRIALGVGAFITFLWLLGATFGAIQKATRDHAVMLGSTNVAPVASAAGINLAIATLLIGGAVCIFFAVPSGRPRRSVRYLGVIAATAVAGVLLATSTHYIVQPGIGAEKQMEAAGKARRAQMQADNAAYLAEMAAAGFHPGDTYASIARRLDSSARGLDAAYAAIDKYDALYARRVQEARADIVRLSISAYQRNRSLERFDREWAQVQPLVHKRWDLERRGMLVREDLIALLRRTRGQWQARGDTLLFARERDLAEAQRLGQEARRNEAERDRLVFELDQTLDRIDGDGRPRQGRDAPRQEAPVVIIPADPAP
jgi:hypothetical protein